MYVLGLLKWGGTARSSFWVFVMIRPSALQWNKYWTVTNRASLVSQVPVRSHFFMQECLKVTDVSTFASETKVKSSGSFDWKVRGDSSHGDGLTVTLPTRHAKDNFHMLINGDNSTSSLARRQKMSESWQKIRGAQFKWLHCVDERIHTLLGGVLYSFL